MPRPLPGRLGVLDILVIAVLFGLLLVAAGKEFPSYTNRATAPPAPCNVPSPTASPAD
jgi:hypothetical protein